VKFVRDFKIPKQEAGKVYNQLRTVSNHCTAPNNKNGNANLAKDAIATGSRNVTIYRGGKSQTATFVDSEGNRKTATVPGTKGMVIIGTKDGVVVK
jgi:hypothetical protein